VESDQVNRWLTLIANFGVLLGLLLLVYEIRQNHEMTRAQTRNEIAANEVDRLNFLAGNDELVDLLIRSNTEELLDEADRIKIRFLRYGAFRQWENNYYQYRMGLFDEEQYVAGKESWKLIVNGRRYHEYWCEFRMQVAGEFRQEIDGIFENLECI